MTGRAVVVQRPDECRTRAQVARHLRKADVIGVESGDNLAVDLPHGRAVEAQEPRLHRFLARDAVVLPHSHERDITADVLAQQFVRLDQVVLVVLLEHAHAGRLGQRAEMDSRGIHRRGDVLKREVEHAARQIDLPDVADERDRRVVDGDGELDLVIQRRRALSIALHGRALRGYGRRARY